MRYNPPPSPTMARWALLCPRLLPMLLCLLLNKNLKDSPTPPLLRELGIPHLLALAARSPRTYPVPSRVLPGAPLYREPTTPYLTICQTILRVYLATAKILPATAQESYPLRERIPLPPSKVNQIPIVAPLMGLSNRRVRTLRRCSVSKHCEPLSSGGGGFDLIHSSTHIQNSRVGATKKRIKPKLLYLNSSKYPPRGIGEGAFLSASTTHKDGVPFLPPVGFAPQKDQLLPASTLKHDALGASDKAFQHYLRNLLHAAPPVPQPPRVALTVIIVTNMSHGQVPGSAFVPYGCRMPANRKWASLRFSSKQMLATGWGVR